MHILIVDDSLAMRLMISKIAQGVHPDADIEMFDNAEAAFEVAKDKKFEFCSLDYTLPGMSGIELGAEIKAMQPNANIVLVTANKQQAVQQRAHDLGVGMVIKPDITDPLTNFFSGKLMP